MTKTLTFIFFMHFSLFVSAQDLIYTISGEINQQKTRIDSILVENISNKTWISFSELPDQDYYQINLTQKAYWGTTGISIIDKRASFTGFQKEPGKFTLRYNQNTPTKAKFSIYQINGQLIFTRENVTLPPGSSVRFKIGQEGIYVIRVEALDGNKTFKAVGSPIPGKTEMEFLASVPKKNRLKSMLLNDEKNFSFSPGDSIRISVFKNGYLSSPKLIKITSSEFVDFLFKTNEDGIVTSGIIKIDGLQDFDYSGISVFAMGGSASVRMNGVFQVMNSKVGNNKQVQVLFTKGDELMFGFRPESAQNNVVTLDQILLFFYNLYPDIRLQEFQQSDLLEIIQTDSNYEKLKELILNSLQKNESPVSDTVFVATMKESAHTAAQIISQMYKSAESTELLDGTFSFHFERDGRLTWDESVPLFAAMGFEVKNATDNSVVYGPEILNPRKIILSVGSIIEWGFDKIFNNIKQNPPPSFNFKNDGNYVITLTNGNYSGNQPPDEMYEKVSVYNRNTFICDLIAVILPQDVAENLIGGCGSAMYDFFTNNIWDFLKKVGLKEDITLGFAAHEIYVIMTNAVNVVSSCAKGIDADSYLNILAEGLEKLDVLDKAESVGKIITLSHDYYFSEISGTESRSFYNGISFSELKFKNDPKTQFYGEPGTEIVFKTDITEKTTTYNFDVQAFETKFDAKTEEIPATGIPFNTKVLNDGDATITNSLVRSDGGSIQVKMTMGEKNSQVKIEPAFENSGLNPVTVSLNLGEEIPDDQDVCLTSWSAAVQDELDVMNSTSLTWAFNPTPENCMKYKQAVEAVLDVLLLYSNCENMSEEDKGNYDLQVMLANSLLSTLTCE